MKLRIKQITLLVAGLSASAVSLAAPVTPAQIEAAYSAGTLQQAWISGATAPTYNVYEGWVSGCEVGTNTLFTVNTLSASARADARPGKIGTQMAYACVRAGKVSILYQSNDGGSLNAYTPHTVATKMPRVQFPGTGNTCSTTTVNFVDPTNSANNALVYEGCKRIGTGVPNEGATEATNATTAAALLTDPKGPQIPVGGFSDVEAALFSASIGGGNVSNRGVEADVGVGQVFGVAVTTPLYRALQAQQGLPQDDDLANAPNITSGQYAYLIAQGPSNWGSLLPGNTTNTVNLQRRVPTSGSQSSSNAFFLRNPCNNAVGASLPPKVIADSVPGFTVYEQGSSSTLAANMRTASASTDPTKNFMIGVLSLENLSDANLRYLKLDGVHPEAGDPVDARKTAVNGDYKFHMELKSFVRSDYAGVPPKTAFEQVVVQQITEALANPPAASCAKLPRGLTLNPANGSVCTVGQQVARMTNGGKNCATAIMFE
jgi:hypothetical protein